MDFLGGWENYETEEDVGSQYHIIGRNQLQLCCAQLLVGWSILLLVELSLVVVGQLQLQIHALDDKP